MVKYITHEMKGLPPLENKFGSLVKLLKAVLADGYNEVVPLEVQGQKIKLPPTHGFVEGQIVRLQYSGSFKEYKVKLSEAEYITLDTLESISTPEKVKGAPLGYTCTYDDITASGTACFKAKKQAYLKVIDHLPPNGYNASWAKFARVVAGSEMGQENFINDTKIPKHPEFPNVEISGDGVSGQSGKHGWLKWYYARRVSRTYGSAETSPPDGQFPTHWTIIGDENTFYLLIKPMGALDMYTMYSFGHLSGAPLFYITGSEAFERANEQQNRQPGSIQGANQGCGLCSCHATSGNFLSSNSIKFSLRALSFVADTYTIHQEWPFKKHPSFAGVTSTGGLVTSPLYVVDVSGALRGTLRGCVLPVGAGEIPHETRIGKDKIVLSPKAYNPVANTSSEITDTIPFIFSLDNWEE